jgi:hypothetical protein
VSRPKTRHSKSSRYKHAVLHLLECASLALSIQDFGTFKGIVKLTHYVTILATSCRNTGPQSIYIAKEDSNGERMLRSGAVSALNLTMPLEPLRRQIRSTRLSFTRQPASRSKAVTLR